MSEEKTREILDKISKAIRSVSADMKILGDDVIIKAINSDAEDESDYLENNTSEEEIEMSMVIYRDLLQKQVNADLKITVAVIDAILLGYRELIEDAFKSPID